MSRCVPQPVSLFGAAFLFLFTSTATAQWSGVPGQMQCQCVQPVVQQVYRTVPVTEFQQVKQTVQRPIVETKWVDREFTEYQPVTETQTAEVPYTTYHAVTEYVPQTRDCGQWCTQRHEIPRYSPCQIDGRPGLAGWWGRTAYSIRSTFTPRYRTTRHYIPNVVTEAVPVTRQVAMQETRKVTYNVTKMVPQTVQRKVAVQNVRYVAEEVTAMRPVTVMRTIPIGTRTAYNYFPYSGGATATALAPSPDPLGAPDRTVDRRNDPNNSQDRFRREADSSFNSLDSSQADPAAAPPATFQSPPPQQQPRTGFPVGQTEGRQRAEEDWRVVTIPTAARVQRWKARNQTAAQPRDRGVSFADSQP